MESFRKFPVRTDMADESHRLWQAAPDSLTELRGVVARSSSIRGFELTEIEITDKEASLHLNKACGKYFSILLPESFSRGSEIFEDAVLSVKDLILRLTDKQFDNVLVAALGNPDISPDALGHLAGQNILVTRHLDKTLFPQFNSIALCRPGVLGTSGIESAEQIHAMAELIRPDLIIAIDALAGSDVERLCRSIQISNSGISPGSGVGNNRAELSFDSLGVPVISIGMPTVIDAEYFGGGFGGMFVTSRNIDTLVRSAAAIIGYGINLAIHHGLDITDIDALLN